MKIIHITPYFMEYIAGQEKFVFSLCNELANQGFDVWILTSKLRSGDRCIESYNGINVIRHRRLFTVMRTPITPSIVKSVLKHSDASIIHVHNPYHFQTLATYIIKSISIMKSKFILHEHGILTLGDVFFDFLVKLYEKTLLRRILKSFDCLIFLSHYSANRIITEAKINIKEKLIRIIPNAIDIKSYSEKAKAVDISLSLNFLRRTLKSNISYEDRFKVLFVGPVIKRKGIDVILNALNILVNKYEHKDILLFIVGGGDQLINSLRYIRRHKLQDYAYVLGPVSEDVLISLYKLSDLVVLPSRAEGVPTTIIEALLLGRPVLATNLPSIIEYFKPYIKTISNDPYIFAITLKKLSEYEHLYNALLKRATNARTYIRSRFDIRYVSKEIIKVYDVLLGV